MNLQDKWEQSELRILQLGELCSAVSEASSDLEHYRNSLSLIAVLIAEETEKIHSLWQPIGELENKSFSLTLSESTEVVKWLMILDLSWT